MQEPTTTPDPEPTPERLTVEVRRLALAALRRYLDPQATGDFTQADFALRVLATLGYAEPPVWVFGDELIDRSALAPDAAWGGQ